VVAHQAEMRLWTGASQGPPSGAQGGARRPVRAVGGAVRGAVRHLRRRTEGPPARQGSLPRHRRNARPALPSMQPGATGLGDGRVANGRCHVSRRRAAGDGGSTSLARVHPPCSLACTLFASSGRLQTLFGGLALCGAFVVVGSVTPKTACLRNGGGHGRQLPPAARDWPCHPFENRL
jgi:hypothetical protein